MARDHDILSDFSKCLINNGDGTFSLRISGGGGGTPGGDSNSVQWNNGGAFAGDSTKFYHDGTYVGIGTNNVTDEISGSPDLLRILYNSTSWGFDGSSAGQGYLSVSNGTIKGFAPGIHSTDGIIVGSFTAHPFSIRQTNNVAVQVQTSGHTMFSYAAPGSMPTAGAQVHIIPDVTGTKGLLIQGLNGQTGNLVEYQDYTGGIYGSVTPTGMLGIGFGTPLRGVHLFAGNGSAINELILENVDMPADHRKFNVWSTSLAGASGQFQIRLLDDSVSSTTKAFLTFDNATGDVIVNNDLYISSGATTTFLEMDDGQNAAVSNANRGRLRYNNLTQTWQVSINGGAYGDLLTSNAGFVVGPGSATDNAIARYDGTTGKLIQDSLITVDDSGNMDVPGTISVNSITTRATTDSIVIAPLDGTASGSGAVTISAGDANSGNNVGGAVSVSAGASVGSGAGAPATFSAGTGSPGGDASLIAGSGTPSTANAHGGNAYVTAGNASAASSSGNGGNVYIAGGTKVGGTTGSIYLQPGDTGGFIQVGASAIQAIFNLLPGDASGFKTVLKPSGTLAADTLFQLPADNGTSGYILSTNGSGVTSWVAGGGDVVGPGSATDNAIARFDGTTGKLIQNSGVTIDDSDNVTIPGKLTVSGGIDPTYLELATGGSANAYIDSDDASSAGASASGHGRLRYNNGGSAWQVSISGAGYVDLLTTSSTIVASKGGTAIDTSGSTGTPKISSGTWSVVTPVADGTYTVGIGVTQNGTITIESGIITAVQQAT